MGCGVGWGAGCAVGRAADGGAGGAWDGEGSAFARLGARGADFLGEAGSCAAGSWAPGSRAAWRGVRVRRVLGFSLSFDSDGVGFKGTPGLRG